MYLRRALVAALSLRFSSLLTQAKEQPRARSNDDSSVEVLQQLKEADIEQISEFIKLTQGADMQKLKALVDASKQMNAIESSMLSDKATGVPRGRRGRRLQNSRHAKADKLGRRLNDLGGAGHVGDVMWVMICGCFVVFMQAGFAMLSAGVCRAKNVQMVLMKNLMDVCVGTVGWYFFGWSIAYGGDMLTPEEEGGWKDGKFADCDADENPNGCGDGYADNGFIGGKRAFAGSGMLGKGENATKAWAEGSIDPYKYGTADMHMWFFQWAFCAAAATIVSGGVAERCRMGAYMMYSFLMSAFIYPVVVCSTWGYGWLETWVKAEDGTPVAGYIDFAGSGVVHLTGGIGALVGSVIVGKRIGRFDPNVDQLEFMPHNQALSVLGTFILWFGWYGFNPGSTLGMSDNETAQKAALVAMNTTLSASTGGLTVFSLRYFLSGKKFDLGGFCNGILAGLVSITAPCSNVETGSAFLIGIIGGFVYTGASALLQKLKIDDPLDAFPVHGACGIWGLFAAAIFDFGAGTDKHHGWGGFSATSWEENGETKFMTTSQAFVANLLEAVFIIGWVGGLTAMIFGIFKALKILRIDELTEEQGMDEAELASPKGYVMESRGSVDASSSKEIQISK